MPTHLVRKTAKIQAVQITTEEEEQLVRSWLAPTGQENSDLVQLIDAGFWFMRDPGEFQDLVYLVHPDDFPKNYEIYTEDSGQNEFLGDGRRTEDIIRIEDTFTIE